MKKKKIFILPIICLLLVGCFGDKTATKKTTTEDNNGKPHTFKKPKPPVMMTDPQEIASFVVRNYWKEFDFKDTTWIQDTIEFEQAFVNYIEIIKYVNQDIARKSIKMMLDSASVEPSMLKHLFYIAERYLYDPNSPMRNEDIYILTLEGYLAIESVDVMDKVRPEYQLNLAMKNRPSMKANDFKYTTDKGETSNLHSIKSKYTLLLFNNPDCPECKNVKEYIKSSNLFEGMLRDNSLRVLAVYPDEDLALWHKADYDKRWINSYNKDGLLRSDMLYDLRAIPTVYLLDKDKKVILKDVNIDYVEWWFNNKNKK